MAGSNPTINEGSRWGFWSLIVTQFQGAFSDNAFKILVIVVLGMSLPPEERDGFVAVVGALFALPFILFSMAGGYLADRFSKRAVTIGTKGLELGIAAVALLGLALGNLYLLLTVVFLLSTQSALFGPSKYGLLPEMLPHRRLSWGNGVLQLGTILAILTGTIAGNWLAEVFGETQVWSGAILVALAGAGLLASLGITRVPPADPARTFHANFVGDFLAQFKRIREDRVLFLSVLGSTYFWFLGAFLQFVILLYAPEVHQATSTQTGYLFGAVAVGTGLGSIAAGYLSADKVEYGLVPLGAFGMTASLALLAYPDLSFRVAAVGLGLLGFFAGFFIVPINALIQHRPDQERRGAAIAATNLLAFVGVFLAAGSFYLVAVVVQLSPAMIFLLAAGTTMAGTGYAVYLLPNSLLRLLFWFLAHSFYRIKVEGAENIPEKGGALIVSNHLSQVDALLLLASTDRFIRFMILKKTYDQLTKRPVARLMRMIPISPQQQPREMIRSLRDAAKAIQEGELVCIFAEGRITRIGQLLPFRRGMEIIMRGVEAPIIPVNLEGAWGSISSFEKGRYWWKLPRRIPYPVTVIYGRPMPPTTSAFEVRQQVQELMSQAFHQRREFMQPLHRSFIRTARRHRFQFAMADGRVPKLRFGAALTRTIFLARRLRPVWGNQEMVGLLLPPSVAGALVNMAALLLGKVPVHLNYTASDTVIASCARQCGIETVVTSKEFLDRVKLKVPGKTILLEDLAAGPRLTEKLGALVLSWFCPVPLLEKALGHTRTIKLDDLATIIFSSGSTGDPKGVMLTHYNINSNVEQIQQVFGLAGRDRILGILPFFHSFGFTVTLMFPATVGVGAVYHPSPLDPGAIGELIREYGVTVLLSTPTFLQTYIRRCAPEDFGSLQLVLAGAEKLPERVAQGFEDTFGLRPLEGYGCTECAPVVTVNSRDFRAAGFRQRGAKRGTIGHPLPGVSVRIVNPETMQPLKLGEAGLLLVRGPNVMKGYLGKPEKTAEVLQTGWYETGDIAAVDEDGFLTITDRLSRFSKIGGEMVPHIKAEDGLHELAGATEQVLVVTGVPDAKKGERLIVLHTLPEEQLKECLEKLPKLDLPNLWMPRADQFFRVEALPLLGIGKLDLRRIRELALELSGD